MVRRARRHPCSTAARKLRPSLTSSRNRSKNTTNESAVMPTATIRPAIPASVSVNPIHSPSRTTDAEASNPAPPPPPSEAARRVGPQARHPQARHRHQAETAVVEEQVEGDEGKPERAGDDPDAQVVAAERRRDLAHP